MRRAHSLLLSVFFSLAASASVAALAADAGDSAAALTGLYAVTFNVHLAAPVPAGTSIICTARLLPGSTTLAPSRWAAPSTTAVAAVSGGRATCSLHIPYLPAAPSSWAGTRPGTTAALSYQIGEISASGAALARARSQSVSGIALPLSGGNASLTLTVQF